MRRKYILLVVMLLSIVACWEQAELTPLPPPPQFLDLPANARIVCPEEEMLRKGSIALWPDIAHFPADDSSKIPDRGGDQTGIVEHCTPIIMLDYKWSEFEQKFWLLIDTPDSKQGWLSSVYVDFVR